MKEPYQPPAADPSREEAPPSIHKRRAGPVARFLSAGVILIAIALCFMPRLMSLSPLGNPDTFPSASPQFLRILVLEHSIVPPCVVIILAMIGLALSFTRRVFMGLTVAFAAAGLLTAWLGILFWLLNNLIKGLAD